MPNYDDGKELKCSFCGKPQSRVRKLIAGPNVYICDECVSAYAPAFWMTSWTSCRSTSRRAMHSKSPSTCRRRRS